MAELRFPTPLLVDEVVLLRLWRAEELPGKLMAFNDPAIQRFSWSRTAVYTEADTRDYFVEQDRARRAGDSLAVALAWPEDESVLLGGAPCALWRRPRACRNLLLARPRGPRALRNGLSRLGRSQRGTACHCERHYVYLGVRRHARIVAA